jgi:hypothetical protein
MLQSLTTGESHQPVPLAYVNQPKVTVARGYYPMIIITNIRLYRTATRLPRNIGKYVRGVSVKTWKEP